MDEVQANTCGVSRGAVVSGTVCKAVSPWCRIDLAGAASFAARAFCRSGAAGEDLQTAR